MLFRQFFDPETSTYTYLLADEDTRHAVLIDTVIEQIEREVILLRELDLALLCTLETHVHADHVTASGTLRERLGSQVVVSAPAGVQNADRAVADGETVSFGSHRLEALLTPGHTDGCVTWLCREEGLAFTGDALLIRGCGRTDFQLGDARTLFHSVRERLFALPDDTRLYPAHDYRGRMVTTVGEEKRFNPRLGIEKTEAEFVEIMAALDLAYPKRIDVAVPANRVSGLHPEARSEPTPPESGTVARVTEQLGRQDAEMWSGLGI